MDVKLDIGRLSKTDNVEAFDFHKAKAFDSPNIMYDQKKKKIFFIDFDIGTWNPDKQKVFDYIMSGEMTLTAEEIMNL